MQYLKMFVAVLGTVLAALVPLLQAGHLTTGGLINVALVGVGALMVFASPNVPGASYTKFVLSALAAGLAALVTFVGAGSLGGVTAAQWIQVLIAAGVAVGVFLVPNAPSLGQAQARRAVQ
jgi:hypothetical protein